MANNQSIAAEISNIRYGPIKDNHGSILFDFRGETCSIKEHKDICLVGFSGAALYIARNYGFLMNALKNP